ncbi:MAG: hypothetical protein SFV23_02485 [Planctomycetaceae bacterium]|nr:hypothetical protein [Planctomycetaceae bacterium]
MPNARTHQALAGIGALVLGGLLSGCNPQSSSDFQTYDQILATEQPAPAPPDAIPADALLVRNDAPGSMTTEAVPRGLFPEVVASPAPTSPGDAVPEAYPEIPASAMAPLNVVDGSSALDILKVADRSGMSPAAIPAVDAVPSKATLPAPARGIELLVPMKEFRAEGPQGAVRVSYDDLDLLKILNMEPVPADAAAHFPAWLSKLDGQPVRIRGFMYPTFESTGIESFVLARDNQICCFGRDPKVYDLIQVSMKSGDTTDYIPNRPFDVVGTFRIEMLAEGGKPMGLYWLDDARVLAR